MNYLQLCARMRQEIRGAGSGPSAVTGQTGLYQDIVNWIAAAHTDIQTEDNGHWDWLRRSFTVDTVADDDTYAYGDCTDVLAAAAISRFTDWRLTDKRLPPKIYLVSGGVGTERRMVYRPWEAFSSVFKIGTQNSGSPVFITEDPQQNLVIGAKPNDIYRITGEYWRGPLQFAANGDEPEFASQYHMIIVYKAMIDYAYNEVAPEILERAQMKYEELEARLVGNRSSFMGFRTAGPLVS